MLSGVALLRWAWMLSALVKSVSRLVVWFSLATIASLTSSKWTPYGSFTAARAVRCLIESVDVRLAVMGTMLPPSLAAVVSST